MVSASGSRMWKTMGTISGWVKPKL